MNLFEGDDGDGDQAGGRHNNVVVSQLERSTSVLKEHYPGYEGGTYDAVPVAGVSSRDLHHHHRHEDSKQQQQQPIPMSFAWPHYNSSGALVSPPYDDDDDDDGGRFRSRSPFKKPSSLRGDGRSSEYTAKFIAPTGVASPRAAQHPSTLNIFSNARPPPQSDGDGCVEESKGGGGGGDLSEYEAKYIRYNGGNYRDIERPSKDLQKRNYPVQFAWTLDEDKDRDKNKSMVDEQQQQPLIRMKRVPNSDQDISEHQREFNWPSSNTTTIATPRRNGLPVVVLDEADMDTSKWQSEYDARCALLRTRQRDLLLNNHHVGGKAPPPPHIAGLPSDQHDKYPTNFVWESPPPPVADDANRRGGGEGIMDNRSTEYGDKFINWPIITTTDHPTITRREPLNIFAMEKKNSSSTIVRGKADDDDDDDVEYEMISKPVMSEYKEQYQASSTSADQVLLHPHNMKSRFLSNDMPSQFAWERMMPIPIPEKTPKPISNNGVRFNEISEYDSVFSWPPSSPAAKLSRPSSSLISSGALIRSSVDNNNNKDADDAVVSFSTNQWISEYDDNTSKMGMIDNDNNEDKTSAAAAAAIKQQQQHFAVIPAGIITVHHESLPHFYAWFDEETAKPSSSAAAAASSKVMMMSSASSDRGDGDGRATEYDDQYVKWGEGNEAKRVVPRWSCVDYNLITNHQKGGGSVDNGDNGGGISSSNVEQQQKSEYDDHFPSYSSDIIKQQYNPYVSKEALAAELASKAPPQFAWPLVDPIDDKKNNNNKKNKKAMRANSNSNNNKLDDDESSEYSNTTITYNKYRPGHGPVSAVYHVTANDRRALLDSPLALKPYSDLIKSSEWQSEYDDRNNTLLLESSRAAAAATTTAASTTTTAATAVVKPVAGIQTQRSPEIPPFGVWQPELIEESNPDHPHHRVLWGTNNRPEQTEYSASFTERALQSEVSYQLRHHHNHHHHHIIINISSYHHYHHDYIDIFNST